MASRIRIVKGSCLACRKRRIKCDLAKPICTQCTRGGNPCNYNMQHLKWCTSRIPQVSTQYQITSRPTWEHASALSDYEKNTMEYFIRRFWPLLTTASTPCSPPIAMALQNRTVFLTTCVIAARHRVLQDGRNDQRRMLAMRGECLSAIRTDPRSWGNSTSVEALQALLLSVLILYFNDGMLEAVVHTQSRPQQHRDGVRAILERMGGIDAVIHQPDLDSLQMLLSEYMSADLTTAILRGEKPLFGTGDWKKIEQGPVWWTQGPNGQKSLGIVFEKMADLAFYQEALGSRSEVFSMAKVREIESALHPSFAPLSFDNISGQRCINKDMESSQSCETIEAYSLVRSFQHAGLIYLYRAICGMSFSHALIQQHVAACLDTIAAIEKRSKILYCMTFPLLVAGAHAYLPRHQHCATKLVKSIHKEIKFTSVEAMGRHLHKVWEWDINGRSWVSLFEGLGDHFIIL